MRLQQQVDILYPTAIRNDTRQRQQRRAAGDINVMASTCQAVGVLQQQSQWQQPGVYLGSLAGIQHHLSL